MAKDVRPHWNRVQLRDLLAPNMGSTRNTRHVGSAERRLGYWGRESPSKRSPDTRRPAACRPSICCLVSPWNTSLAIPRCIYCPVYRVFRHRNVDMRRIGLHAVQEMAYIRRFILSTDQSWLQGERRPFLSIIFNHITDVVRRLLRHQIYTDDHFWTLRPRYISE